MTASIQLVVFEVAERLYGVPLDRVEHVVRAVDIIPLPRMPAAVLGIIDVHGTLVPVFSVRHQVGAVARGIALDDHFVIVRTSRRTAALVVDRVRGVVASAAEAVIAPEAILPQWSGVAGVVQLEDGLTLIQNLDRFLSLDEEQQLDDALREQAHREK